MLTQSYVPIVGGVERMVEELSAHLVARGHEVAVATLRQPGAPAEATSTASRSAAWTASSTAYPG